MAKEVTLKQASEDKQSKLNVKRAASMMDDAEANAQGMESKSKVNVRRCASSPFIEIFELREFILLQCI